MNGDHTYTVYRAGRDAPLRRAARGAQDAAAPAAAASAAVATASADAGTAAAASPVSPPPEPLAALSPRRREGSHRRRSIVLWTLAAAAAVAGIALLLAYGRQPIKDFWAVLDIAKSTGEIPSWLLVGVPGLALVLAAAVTAYLAFGRHLALKVVGLVVVTAALAAPGFALGWTNGTLGEMGDRAPDVAARVKHAREKLERPLPGSAVNILLLGADIRPGDPGRADTMVLVRLDPKTKSITMLSFPRDLYVDIPGYGFTKMNNAYPYGGPALVVETVGQLTGLPVHHFIEIDFGGFWHVVNVLDGVYYPVDRRYYNPESSTWKSIDIEPGYQRLDGHDALDFVRFRHDARGDFVRMQRQQSFLKEMQRQSGRWSKDWTKVTNLLKAVTARTTSDLDSLDQLLPLANLALSLDTSKVHTVHIEGASQMMNGLSYVVATPEEIQAAVDEFSDPTPAPLVSKGGLMPKKAYTVRVLNGSGVPGVATTVAAQLEDLGYNAVAADAGSYGYENCVVYAPRGMKHTAEQFVSLLSPAELKIVPRSTAADGITVVVGTTYDGQLAVPEEQDDASVAVTEGRYDEAGWRGLDAQSPMVLQMPSVWGTGLVYDQFRAYRIERPDGRQAAAAVAVGRTPRTGYFSIQAMRWTDPPAIAHPSATKTIGGTKYLLFYNGAKLHMVAWRQGSNLYWVLNTLEDELPADFMMALATSFEPIDPPSATPQPEASPSP